jgi:hypothetical protein
VLLVVGLQSIVLVTTFLASAKLLLKNELDGVSTGAELTPALPPRRGRASHKP